MKKLMLCILSTFLMCSVIPTQLKADTENNPISTTAKTDIKTTESNIGPDMLIVTKPIEMSAISSSENKDVLKEASPLKNNQDGRGRRYQNRHDRRDVNVTITPGHQRHSEGYYEGNHSHGGAYLGAGGVLILILILVLIL